MIKNKKFLAQGFISIVMIVFIAIGFLKFGIVHAASGSTCVPLGEQTVRDSKGVVDASTEDPNPNVVSQYGKDIGSNLAAVSALLVGPAKKCGNSITYKYLPKYLENGIAGYVEDTTYTAFLGDELIPYGSFYAQILTPPIFRNNGAIYANSQFSSIGNMNAFKIIKTIKPVQQLWSLMLVISIVGFVFMMVVAGFMVMFRDKIGGQVVVTIAMAIKNLFLGMIGAVFSFGFGGIFFNISKVLTFFLGAYFVQQFSEFSDAGKLVFPSSTLSMSSRFVLSGVIGSKTKSFVQNLWNGAKALFSGKIISVLKSVFTGLASGLIVTLALIAVSLFVMFISFKIFWKLINVYVSMLLQIILAPIIFMFAALPGRESMITDWFKKMFVYAMTIPAMFLLLNFAYLMMVQDFSGVGGGLDAISGGTFSSNFGSAIIEGIGLGRIIGMVILMMVPKADDWLKETFGVKDSQAAKQAMAEGKQTLAQTKIPFISSFG